MLTYAGWIEELISQGQQYAKQIAQYQTQVQQYETQVRQYEQQYIKGGRLQSGRHGDARIRASCAECGPCRTLSFRLCGHCCRRRPAAQNCAMIVQTENARYNAIVDRSEYREGARQGVAGASTPSVRGSRNRTPVPCRRTTTACCRCRAGCRWTSSRRAARPKATTGCWSFAADQRAVGQFPAGRCRARRWRRSRRGPAHSAERCQARRPITPRDPTAPCLIWQDGSFYQGWQRYGCLIGPLLQPAEEMLGAWLRLGSFPAAHVDGRDLGIVVFPGNQQLPDQPDRCVPRQPARAHGEPARGRGCWRC